MTDPHDAPYGAWKSPITADLIVSEAISLAEIELEGDDTYWIEGRPSEEGRNVIVRRDAQGQISDQTPPPFNARTRVHEYGGGAYTVDGETVYFSNFADNRLYRQDLGREPEAVSSEGQLRYADMVVDRTRNRIVCVREDHSNHNREAINTLVAVHVNGQHEQEVLVSGNDFYSSPRISPDGSQLAWLTWNHPNMPWDGTELWIADIQENGSLRAAELVAGGVRESVFQPEWSPDGTLYFVSDRTGWWNIYRRKNGDIEPLVSMEAEFGAPQWVFGTSTYAFTSSERLVCCINRGGTSQLASIRTTDGTIEPIDTPYSQIGSVHAQPDRAVFLGGSPTLPTSVVEVDLASGDTAVLRQSTSVTIDEGYLSMPEPIEFPTENGLTAHAIYYPPHNREYRAAPGELPPLIVSIHGGPTSASSTTFNLSRQYWTSRGFAVLDVNYGGSTGYGRAYRERLNGQWGVVDVDDAVNGARYLVDRGLADPERLIIHGGSAGGYTTLAAMTFRDVFAAGASYFGIADLDPFVDDTHKFESRYTERLVGPYPEAKELYVERSPIHHTDHLSRPIILFQGLDDKVVPPNQAEIMVEGLRERRLPYTYVAFEGEGHGFRKAENIKRMLDGELYFYSRIFGFELPEPVEPVQIENLDKIAAGAR